MVAFSFPVTSLPKVLLVLLTCLAALLTPPPPATQSSITVLLIAARPLPALSPQLLLWYVVTHVDMLLR
jgi:hypothetical protein